MYMVKKEIVQLHEKLDKIYDLSMVNNGDLKAVKEHLKTLNGKVIHNMKEIEKVREELEKQQVKCEKHFVCIEDKVNVNENEIMKAQGAMKLVSVFSVVVGLVGGFFGLLKLLKFW